MATLSSTTSCKLNPPTTKPISKSPKSSFYPVIFSIKPVTRSLKLNPSKNTSFLTTKRRNWIIGSVTEDKEVVSLKNESKELEAVSSEEKGREVDENDRLITRAINATIVLGAGTVAVTKLLTIDHDYWHVSHLLSWIVFLLVWFFLFWLTIRLLGCFNLILCIFLMSLEMGIA